jgi:uncharacterized MnhB-related membrane protein
MVILTILVLGAMVVAGPLLTGQIGSEAQQIVLSLPFAIGGTNSVAISSWQAILGLLVITAVVIGAVGAGLTFLFSLLEKQTSDVLNSEEFQTKKISL